MWERGKKKLHIYIGAIRESQQSCKDLKKKKQSTSINTSSTTYEKAK